MLTKLNRTGKMLKEGMISALFGIFIQVWETTLASMLGYFSLSESKFPLLIRTSVTLD